MKEAITTDLLERLPYTPPFRFVDEIQRVDDNGISGSFHLRTDLDFFKGHFKDHPITPGVILTEIMAQIGVVCLGIFLTGDEGQKQRLPFVLTSTNIEFYKPVYPDETVWVESEKIYFRFGKLKCKVMMKNTSGETVCEGVISGIQIKQNDVTA